ncbi:MAG TPA: BON domain-containing protein [Egibacteraceae bacterium]|nr:BON domain-containing protein [Actinomycetota bacterium]HWB72194.1 BON domain-containing protein [Egibacteraceae bacterium]
MGQRLRKAPLVLAACAAGAAVQYLFDPDRGRQRRIQAKDQAAATVRGAARRAQDRVSKRSQYAQDRAKGIAHELTTPSDAQVPEEDRTLVDKVRSEVLGSPEFSGYTVNVNAVEGVVTLRGQLDRPEQIRDLREAVSKVPGVRQVEDFLHLPDTPPPNL